MGVVDEKRIAEVAIAMSKTIDLPSLCSAANVHTRIKSLFRTCIENNYL